MKKKLFTLMTLLLCLCSGAWAEDQTFTVTNPQTSKKYISGNVIVTGNPVTNGTISNTSNTKCYQIRTGSYAPLFAISKAQNIKSVKFRGARNTSGSSLSNAFSLKTSSDAINYSIPDEGFSVSMNNNGTISAPTSLTNLQMVGKDQSYATEITVSFTSPVMAVTLAPVADTYIDQVVVEYDDAILPTPQLCEFHITSTSAGFSNSGCTFTKTNISTSSSDYVTLTDASDNSYYYAKSSGTYGKIDLGEGKSFAEGDEIWIDINRNSSGTVGVYLNKENSSTDQVSVESGTYIAAGTQRYIHYVTKKTDPWVGQRYLWILRGTGSSNVRLYQLAVHRAPSGYDIILDDNGEYQGNGSATVKVGDASLTISSQAKRTGYSVTGYYAEVGCEIQIAEADGTLLANKTGFTDEDGKWTATEDKTLYAAWEAGKYTVTIAKNENNYGTVTSESVADVAYNTTVSATDNVLSVGTTDITATPAAATAEYTYAFNNWTGIPEGGKVTEDATVTANFTRTPVSYNLAWDANGDGATLSGNYTQGSTAFGTNITKPTATREGYVLLGWSTTPNGDIVNITTMPAETTTYFAQWGDIPNVYYYKNNYSDNSYKNPEGGDASGSDNVALTTPWTIDNGTITGLTSVVATNAVYDNKSNHMNSYIKLRPADSGRITFTVASGYKATIKIKMGGYSANTNITMKLNDAGDNISYTGTMSGAATSEDGYALLTYSNLLGGAYTLKPTSSSLYISEINVTTEENTIPATISAAEYATFYNADKALDFSTTGITVYTAEDKATSVRLNEITSGQVPANTPVVLYKEGADGTAINVPVIASADAVGSNDLRVSTGTDVPNMFVLAKKNGVVGFYKWAGTTDLSAGKVYLLSQTSGARDFLGFEETTTGINAMDNSQFTIDNNAPMYNLAGQRVTKSYKGVVIVNGKKIVRK